MKKEYIQLMMAWIGTLFMLTVMVIQMLSDHDQMMRARRVRVRTTQSIRLTARRK